ncbi:hypothetical protein EON63_04160 [archaeon]|nr:MAG: hypothetical protein EON63_04160 [archaeon]
MGSQPEAICSTGYIMQHNWTSADGVMIFNKSVLPGYSALFRHANGDMYVGKVTRLFKLLATVTVFIFSCN